jgi:NitT/TauT family transport system substrate-binding protein
MQARSDVTRCGMARSEGISGCTRIASGLLLAGLLLAPGFAEAQEQPVRIGIGVDAAYAPMFLAKREKLFEKHGADVVIQTFSNAGEGIDASVAGVVDVSGVAEPTAIIRMGRGDIRGLAIFGESGKYIKLAVRDGITDVKQIQTIGYTAGNVSEYSTGKLFQRYGLDRAHIKMIPSGMPELPALMARGSIDAFFAPEPWPGQAVKLGGKVLMNSGDVGYAYTMWLTANGAWFDAHHKEAQSILGALAEACDEIRADPNKGAEATQAESKIPAQQVLGVLAEITCKVRDFTPDDMASYDQVADFLANANITKGKVDYKSKLTVGFYK